MLESQAKVSGENVKLQPATNPYKIRRLDKLTYVI
jgi:hypothetical protein